MNKVIVKITSDQIPPITSVLKLLKQNSVNTVSISVSGSVFVVKCSEASDMDKLFSTKCISDLANIDCSPVLPPRLKALRTILVHNVEPIIYHHSVDEIKLELERTNNYTKVDDIYKFEKSKLLKITFSDQQTATRTTEQGIYLFDLHVPPTYISRDMFFEVAVCYRCYKLDSHVAKDCDLNDDYLICSLCSEHGHLFKNCKNPIRKCINCEGNHSTLSLSCPARKDIISNKRKAAAKVTFATKVTSSPKQASNGAAPSRTVTASLLNGHIPGVDVPNIADLLTRSMLCVIMATLSAAQNESSFDDALNDLLTANGLASFSMGKIKPPLGSFSSGFMQKLLFNFGELTRDANRDKQRTTTEHEPPNETSEQKPAASAKTSDSSPQLSTPITNIKEPPPQLTTHEDAIRMTTNNDSSLPEQPLQKNKAQLHASINTRSQKRPLPSSPKLPWTLREREKKSSSKIKIYTTKGTRPKSSNIDQLCREKSVVIDSVVGLEEAMTLLRVNTSAAEIIEVTAEELSAMSTYVSKHVY